ncbi:MAG: hypothetical protein U9R10_00055 [Euryarchaeota archaeon]|nr:hypothetical protein [Euryarchaeota archaeon]
MSSEKHKLQILLASRSRRRMEPGQGPGQGPNQVPGSSEAVAMSYRTETQAKHLKPGITCTIAVSERQWI